MKKIIILSGFIISIMFYQLNIQAAEIPTCVILQNNLRFGSRDGSTKGEVSQYQEFLRKSGYLSIKPTGYFGALTVQATKKFQLAQSLKADGIIGLNGGKAVFLASRCNFILVFNTPVKDINSPVSSDRLQILRVDGPATLKKGETGTWTVVTNIPTKSVPVDNVNYNVDWGIGYSNTYKSKTISFAYPNSGFNTITFGIYDPLYGYVEFKKNIKITDVTDSGITVTSPNAGEKYKVGDTLNIRWNGPMRLISLTDLDYRTTYTLTQLSTTQTPDTSGLYKYVIPANVLKNESGRYSVSVYKTFGGIDSPELFDTSDEFVINRGCILPQKWSGYACAVPPASSKVSISSVSSNSGLVGSKITINGEGFSAAEDQVYFDKGSRNITAINPDQITNNQIVFTVPNLAPDSYVIRVRRGEYAQSNEVVFNVTASILVTNPNEPVSINLISPNDTVNYTAGEIIPIKWSSNASPSASVTILLERHDDRLNGRNAVTVKTIKTSNSGEYGLLTTTEDNNKQFPCPNGCSTDGLSSVFGVRVILGATKFDESDSFFAIIN